MCLWQKRGNEVIICVVLLAERNDRENSREGQFYSETITHIFSLPALQIHWTERFVMALKSPLQSQSLFTQSLPKWKISSASVKIHSKKENPLPVSTIWLMKWYFMRGRQWIKGWRGAGLWMEGSHLNLRPLQAFNSCWCAFEHHNVVAASVEAFLACCYLFWKFLLARETDNTH